MRANIAVQFFPFSENSFAIFLILVSQCALHTRDFLVLRFVLLRQTPSKTQTDGRTERRVSSSVVSVRVVHPTGERTAMLHRNLKGEGDKNPGSTNKYTKFGQLIIRKIIKIIATRCHILMLNYTKFYSRRLSVRPSVRLLDGA